MTLNVFGSAPLQAFQESGPGDGPDFAIAEHLGRTLIIQVSGPIEKQTNDYGVKTAIECPSIVSLGADAEGTVYEDVLIFQSAPVSQLRKLGGQTIVATVVTYQPKRKGAKTAYKLDAPSAEQAAAAEAYVKANAAA